MLSGGSYRGVSGPHEDCPRASGGGALRAHHQGNQGSSGATQCPHYKVGHIEEVVVLLSDHIRGIKQVLKLIIENSSIISKKFDHFEAVFFKNFTFI